MAPQRSDALAELLTRLGIETRFHALLVELCGAECDYLYDIALSDLDGRCDSNGIAIPVPVARGLLRKLQAAATTDSMHAAQPRGKLCAEGGIRASAGREDGNVQIHPHAPDTLSHASATSTCSVTLRRADGNYASMVRCGVRGRLRQNDGGGQRRKVLTAVLDNSGSMRNEWPLVVDAVSRVFTDELLHDPQVSLNAIAYNTTASEVVLPHLASALPDLLLRKFAPGGITNFQSAFELAERIIRREVGKHVEGGIRPSAIDVTTLLFTDGEDTSVPPRGSTSVAATAKARVAGDMFRGFLRALGCPAHTCIAAFGQQHNPEQCQYLSDRYFYINRKEVLSEWLTSNLAELLESAGHCSLRVQLPHGLVLAEPLPTSIGLDAHGCLEYEVWFHVDPSSDAADNGTVVVEVEDSGTVVLCGSAEMSSAVVVRSETLEGRIFLLDSGEMLLRKIALELRGRRPSSVELARLQERLVGVKELVRPVADVASQITARLCGRAVLRARLEELEARRNRLSYALGHFDDRSFDTRNIGSVGIDAILRDASQRASLGATATACAHREEAAAALPPPEPLSPYGQKCTFDSLSGCDAKAAAEQGDAIFFRLRNVSFSATGSIASATDCGSRLVAYEAFMVLSQDGSKPVHADGDEEGFTHVGLPFYATPGHFLRTKLLLRDVLQRLSPKGTYAPRTSERLLLNLLGHALASHLGLVRTGSAEGITLMHKVRGVFAVLEATSSPAGCTLLDEVIAEADRFLDTPELRKDVEDLFMIAAVGLLAHGWTPKRLASLGDAVIEEAARRALARELQNASESERLRLAWAVLGPPALGDEWLDEPVDGGDQRPELAAFDILTATAELEELEQVAPGRCSPRDVRLLAQLFASAPRQAGTPRAIDWSALRTLLSQWGLLVEEEGGTSGLWRRLDLLMVDGKVLHEETLQRFGVVLQPQPCKRLRDALVSPASTLSAVAMECLRSLPQMKGQLKHLELAPRLAVAATVRAVVARREAMARKHPITKAGYPFARPLSAEDIQDIWGAPAAPADKSLYEQARRDAHRRHAKLPYVVKEALSDKEYRERGGRFVFPTRLDTFIPGLHRRTKDLHVSWKRGHRAHGPELRAPAIQEMLLRLRWDDQDQQARAKLSRIIGMIWDGLEGDVENAMPISSALWLVDGEGAAGTERAADKGKDADRGPDVHTDDSNPASFMTAASSVSDGRNSQCMGDAAGEADWKLV